MSTDTLIEVAHLMRYFDVSLPWLERALATGDDRQRRVLRAVDDVSFTIPRGTTFALVGESGCGKSTAARCIVGLTKPNGGTVRFQGIPVAGQDVEAFPRQVRHRVQMIFQDPYASLNPRWRVAAIIAEPLLAHGLVADRAAARNRVGGFLRDVGLNARDARKFPHQFSGGQRQRISIARALASEPDFIVCDEPTSALDVSVQAQILNLMKDLQAARHLTYLFISHDLAVVNHMADQVGVMYLGRLCEVADTGTLFASPRHPYTKMLLDSIPQINGAGRERTASDGEVPDPISPPSGCAFHPRCPLAVDRCRRDRPELKSIYGVSVACHAIA